MHKIIQRPVLASIFFVAVILFGLYSYSNLPIELVPRPDQGLPSLSVSFNWNGASPDMILKRVLIPAEAEIMQIKGVEKLGSWAGQASGRLDIEFSRGTRMNFANVVLKERLNRLKKHMPKQVSGPFIQPHIPREFQRKPFFRIGVYGENLSMHHARRIAEREILPRLKAIPGVESVKLQGGVGREIKIQTMKSKLEKYDVDIREIAGRLKDHFYSHGALGISKSSGEITLALSQYPKSIDEIREIVIKNDKDKKILLKDVASVFSGYEKIVEEARYQGKSYIRFVLYKEANRSHLKVAQRIREKLNYLANRMKGRVEFVIQSDDSKELKEQLLKLGRIAFLILLIIFVILIIIVRDLKATLLIFSSVFFSVCTTLTFIYLFKIPLNLLTMSGLALGFGLFVDNAVVVFDSILRFRENGMDKLKAAAEGARAVILPVLSSTFTTIIVFFSFALLFKDRLRIYYMPLAYIIAISLLSSVVVSFVLIPSLSARINIKVKGKNAQLSGKRGKFFPFILKYPLVIILPIILVFILSFTTFLEEVSFGRFFSFNFQEKIKVGLYFPQGVEFEDVRNTILPFERTALEKPYPKEVNLDIMGNNVYMEVSFPPEIRNSALPLQLKQELIGLATNLAGIGVTVSGFDQDNYHFNPNTGSYLPYSIQLTGYNFERLLDFTHKLKDSILSHKRIKEAAVQTDMKRWFMANSEYFSLTPDREKLRHYNIVPSHLLYLLSAQLHGNTRNTWLKFDSQELPVEIKASDTGDVELDEILDKYRLFPGTGKSFRFRDLMTLNMTRQKGGISREDQQYQSMVQWDLLGSPRMGDRYFKARYDSLQVPTGFKKKKNRDMLMLSRQEEHQLFWAFIASLALIYLILGMLYENFLQPLLIMLSLPLAAIGVFIAFVVMDFSWDATAWIGAILLSGIVVNNAILLIDHINRHLKKSKRIIEAIAAATKERIRPIFMTTLTTVLGMLPLVIFRESGADSDIWSSLALCTVGGLTSSAIFILLVLPIFYYLFFKMQKHLVSISWR